MGRRTKPRVTNPEFIQYANMAREFAVSTRGHHDVAWRLVATFFPGVRWRWGYTPEKVWQELKAHQPAFRAVLEGLSTQQLTPAQLGTIRLHVGHFGPHPHWDHSPAQSCIDPEQAVDLEPFGEVFEPQDPLDPLYYQLHLFLRTRPVQDLKHCPLCGRYFVARTARGVYCSDPCRQQAHPVPAEAKREAVRKHRARETQRDRDAVKAAVQQVRDAGADELVFEEVWARFRDSGQRKVGRKRFKRLLREEIGADLVG